MSYNMPCLSMDVASRDHPVLGMSIRAAGVGCHDSSRVVTVRNTAPLIEVLHALVRANISSVPIVDAEGRVVDVYSRQDAMYLTRIKKLSTAHLNATVVEVLKAQCLMLEREGLHTCSADDSLGVVIQRMVCKTLHPLYRHAYANFFCLPLFLLEASSLAIGVRPASTLCAGCMLIVGC